MTTTAPAKPEMGSNAYAAKAAKTGGQKTHDCRGTESNKSDRAGDRHRRCRQYDGKHDGAHPGQARISTSQPGGVVTPSRAGPSDARGERVRRYP